MKKVKFITFGCKVNQYETEVLREKLLSYGFCEAKDSTSADFVVINSCAVTAEGERKMRQTLRRTKKDNPNAVIALFGCVPQAFPDSVLELPADIILGNKDISKVFKAIISYSGERIIDISEHKTGDRYNTPAVCGMFGRTRAYMKIQDGCDRFCSYCIIPYSRGRVRSRSIEDIRLEAQKLADSGFKEIVLTGINLTAFGKDTGESFADAIDAAASPEGIKRVRLGSLEPDFLDDSLLSRMAKQPKLCPQFHLSLQSGCDDTLKRMNRHYDFEFYRSLVSKLREKFADCAITTDVMVGFAGESEEEFVESLNNVLSIGFAKVHVFPYSIRKGTRAADFKDHLPNKIKEERSKILIEKTEKSKNDFLATQVGKTYPVLFEQGKCGIYEGSTPNYSRVSIKSEKNIAGEILNVFIENFEDGVLKGYIVD